MPSVLWYDDPLEAPWVASLKLHREQFLEMAILLGNKPFFKAILDLYMEPSLRSNVKAA